MTLHDKIDALMTAIRSDRRQQKDRHMEFVELAFRVAPREAAAIERKVIHGDERITEMCKELCRLCEHA